MSCIGGSTVSGVSISWTAAIADAVEDALAPWGVVVGEMPLTGRRIFELRQTA